VFGAAVVEYLGHNVSQQGLTPAEAKVLAIRELKVPTNISELRQVLGFMNYYRGYVPNYNVLQALHFLCPRKFLSPLRFCFEPKR
jgi:hypothetical protein